MDRNGSARMEKPLLPGVRTTDLNHPTGHDLAVDEQAAVLQAMSLESPPGLVQSPTSMSSDFGYISQSGPSSPSTPMTPMTPLSPTGNVTSPTQSKFATAFQEARYFAGGLIAHPYESTKHYSILRHSHGLVYYSGSTTSLAITIFSDQELPADRTLWLQRRGFSGNTGMKIGGLLGARSSWIDVTPTVKATADQVNPNDERAWQRDIKKFLKKASKDVRNHRVRETNILRIPTDADDGYLRVVLCTNQGKKVLCGSPVFRLASSSTDSSTLRGSSLMTMPLEAGLKIASIAGKTAVNTYTGALASTAKTTVTNQVSAIYQPSFVAQEAMTRAYDESGITDRIDNMNKQYGDARDGSFHVQTGESYDALARPDIVGDDSGPVAPFPIRFHGKVVTGTGKGKASLNMPTANLSGVPEEILLKHRGVFFGWAAINLPQKLAAEKKISDEWHKAVIFISPDMDGRRTVVQRNTVRVYLIHDFQSVQFLDAKLSVIVMGYLRTIEQLQAGEEPDVEAQMFDLYKDVTVTTASLSRPAWAAATTLERVKSAQSSRNLTERYVDFRQTTQKQIDRVPVHRLGVRTEGAALKDRLIGNGGVWIPRQP